MTRLQRPPGRTSMTTVSSGTSAGPPYQSAKRSASVHSRQTSSRGASKVQLITISELPLPPGASAMGGLPRGALQPCLHPFEATLPKTPVSINPLGDQLQRRALEVGGAQLRRPSARDQPGPLQHLEVLGDRLDRDRQGLGQLAHGGVARG